MRTARALLSLFIVTMFLPKPIFAHDQSNTTLIINQVRGVECCDAGKVEHLQSQLQAVTTNNMVANWAVRFDALHQPEMIESLKAASDQEVGGLLEVTPSLAQAAGVTYKGRPEQWYEAQNIFLIGYTQPDRQKLIDAYMKKFYSVWTKYPSFTTAWMIDAWSLQYLRDRYGVRLHQLTREQFGTDSYTLYGGPVQHPYYPSEQWALVPHEGEELSTTMPLIVRQTIMDPVLVYGDTSDSYTSQPNDYALRQDSLEYFKHLFQQAHNQPQNHTFAVVGLENSMADVHQREFERQLMVIKEWQATDSHHHQIMSAAAYVDHYQKIRQPLTIYGGQVKDFGGEKAWWINTPKYRARVRLSDGELFISDLRLYDPSWSDPYLNQPAGKLGWWIVPYVVDGSRMITQLPAENPLSFYNDHLRNRPETAGQPQRLMVANGLNPEGITVTYSPTRISFTDQTNQEQLLIFEKEGFTPLRALTEIGQDMFAGFQSLQYTDARSQALWGFKLADAQWQSFVSEPLALEEQRRVNAQWLFPELVQSDVSADYSELYVNNKWAVAGRNPVRLVFFPRTQHRQPVLLDHFPSVSTTNGVPFQIEQPHGSNGMFFIDMAQAKPSVTNVTVAEGNFSQTVEVFLAPNCRKLIWYCLTHPHQAWWYWQAYRDDQRRAEDEAAAQQRKFVDQILRQ